MCHVQLGRRVTPGPGARKAQGLSVSLGLRCLFYFNCFTRGKLFSYAVVC